MRIEIAVFSITVTQQQEAAGRPGSTSQLLPPTTTEVTAADQFTSQITEKGRDAEGIIQVKSFAAVRWLLGGWIKNVHLCERTKQKA